MGSSPFEQFEARQAERDTVRDAFQRAVERARYDHGHAGYTGSLAEKHDYVMMSKNGPVLLDEAQTMAQEFLDQDDERVSDKWGPAGVLPVVTTTRDVDTSGFAYTPTDGFPRYGRAIDPALEHAVLAVLRQNRLIRRGETIKSVSVRSYVTDQRPTSYGYRHADNVRRSVNATVTLTKAKSALADVSKQEPDGWLFFGWASS